MSKEENNSEIPNDKGMTFFKVNLVLFLPHILTGGVLFFLTIPTLIITGLLVFGFNKRTGQALGYTILFYLILATIGFSICMGSINIH
ncbi:MAG: hypothetical protein JKY03_08500 [Aureispira sp.]|nr:hypothetical protein [Aureispira sp.]